MDDEFMLRGLRKPRAAFARQLSERLQRLEAQQSALRMPRTVVRWAACAAVLFLAVGAFALPSVQAGARAFLDIFRVVNFAPVAVRMDRIDRLMARHELDLPRLLGEQVQVLKAAGPLQTVATAEAAGSAAGIQVRTPAWRPVGLDPRLIQVGGEQALSVTASTEKLRAVMDAFGIDDLSVPDEVNGQSATVHVPAIVRITYSNAERHAVLVQSRQPEVAFPAGVDLASLAEIGLRVLGIDRTEAHRFAQNVDWRTTLILPVPADIAAFRQIDIQGNAGVLIETARRGPGNSIPETCVLWSSRGSVFALTGNLLSAELFEMAQSVQ